MKAVILSGGMGTRLRPLTDNMPKTMVEIEGKPLLWYHVQNLKKHGVNNIWMALQYLPEVIQDYFGDGSKFGVKIKYSIEQEALGTAGALKNHQSSIEQDLKKDKFLVIYGDNFTDFNYTKLIKFHDRKSSTFTIGLYEAQEPWTMGVVEIDANGKIKKFVEKPPKEEVKSNLVSAGVILADPEILDYIPSGFSDFGFDIFPKMLSLNKSLYALNPQSYVQDVGTIQRLTKARNDFRNGKIKI